jgi:nucleoside diphosphate kinase
MARELAFVLINPYTIAKSRTGGVIARYTGRTDLNFVAARMFGPSEQLVREYAALIREADKPVAGATDLIPKYVLESYSPIAATGKRRRVMMLLFEGEDAIRKIWEVTGSATLKEGSGQTVRDTYGDYIVNGQGEVRHFEPAVLVAPNKQRAAATLTLWAKYSARDGGLLDRAIDVPEGDGIQKTLVMLKPDSFRTRSYRPGSIIDVLSTSGLRIIAVKKFSMTVAQAEEFYGPVREALRNKFREIGSARAAAALSREFGFSVPMECMDTICTQLGPLFADAQFESIVKFMTGFKPSDCSPEEKTVRGKEECLALVYDGADAVSKIRGILGATDPSKASPGSVRHEFGSDVMVNSAHASDSPESVERELRIIRVGEDTIKPWVDRYYPGGIPV